MSIETSNPSVQIRPLTEADIDTVLVIEQSSFDHPWARSNFLDEFKNEDLTIPLGLERDSRLIGFAFIWIIVDECHLANIAIHPDFRRMGFSKLLMNRIIEIAREKKCLKIMLEVRKSNREAIALYRQYGFVQVGVRKNYYHDGFLKEEDALLLDLNLT